MNRTPLRRQLILIAVAGILPLAVLSAIGLALLFVQQREAEQTRALGIARAMATAVDAELQRSVSSLQVIAAAMEQDNLDLDSFDDLVRRVLPRQPRWSSLIVADASGTQVVHSKFKRGEAIPPNPEPESVAEVVRTGEPRVGSLVKGHAGWGFALRVPVVKDGRVHYVLSAVATPQAFLEIVRNQNISADWSNSVFDAKGNRVARSKNHEQLIGTRPSESLAALLAQGKPEGIGVSRTFEGDTLFTAYARAPRSGWVVVIGLPQTLITGPAIRTTSVYAVALALSIIAGLAAAFTIAGRINRPMSRLRAAAQTLGAGGEPEPVETPLREVQEVGDALQRAAAERRAAEAEREELLHREQAARGEAEAANRAKDQFLAMLGHELRNPIAAISNATGLLEMAAGDARATARSREIIKRQVSHLARLTDDLLDAARAVLGKIELRTEPVDLAAVAAHALSALSASGRDARHRVQGDLAEAWVLGDPVRLEQVIANLLVNAVKYTPEGGRIHVRTGRDGERAFVSVADDGVGLAPELAARAFDLFVQGRRDIDRSQGGLGIGLTLVRRIAELHGGTATLHSAGENLGAEFTVSLPAAEPLASAAAPGVVAIPHVRTVLVVEDNDDARETLKALLEAMGQRVAVARDGVAGVEKALALAPDLALVDLGLPGLDGYEVARRIRANPAVRNLYLVALTGYGTADARAEALAAGFDAHLTKPVSPETLRTLLASPAPRSTTTA